jgi:hypothetical protein
MSVILNDSQQFSLLIISDLQPLIEIGKIEVFQNLQASGVRFFIIL